MFLFWSRRQGVRFDNLIQEMTRKKLEKSDSNFGSHRFSYLFLRKFVMDKTYFTSLFIVLDFRIFASRSVDENKKHKNSAFEENKPKNPPTIRTFEKPIKVNSKRLAPLKIAEDSVAISDFNNLQNLPSPPKERDKPPIVLRIFKGTSQLISETGSKSSDPSDDDHSHENADLDSRLTDNPTNSSGVAAPSEARDTEAAATTAEPAFCTRSSRRRTPEKSKSPTPEPPPIVPVKISRRHVEKAKSPSPEALPEPSSRATRSLRRRSPEKVKSPEPSEPAKTTRSLRRRGAAAAVPPAQPVPEDAPSVAAPPPQTSPKRTLRSQKNMAPPPSKIVITNLKSDHPSVYINDATTTTQPQPLVTLPSPSRKEAKETRSYSNRHKHKHANRLESAAKNEAELKKVEEFLADLSSGDGVATESIDAPPETTSAEGTQSTLTADLSKSSADSSLDSDRAELLQLLEDDDDADEEECTPLNDLAAASSAKSPALPEVVEPKEEPAASDEPLPTIINSDSELKIKIKISDLRKSSVESEVKEEPPETSAALTAPDDCVDSGIGVAFDSQMSCGSVVESTESSQKSPEPESQTLDLSKECEDRLSGPNDVAAANSDSEVKGETSGASGSAMPAAASINKKGSIFKHRASSNGNKKRALYKHKWVDDKDGAQTADDDKSSQPVVDNKKALDSIFDADVDDMPLTKFIRKPTENSFDFDEPSTVTGVKCAKKNKDVST